MPTPKFEVILNRCAADEHENEVTCDCCGEKGTVAIICGRRVCKTCLTVADVAINRAVMSRLESLYVPSTD